MLSLSHSKDPHAWAAAETHTEKLPEEAIYRWLTVAAMVLLLVSLWVF